jgi:HEAT repeat protein
MVGRRSRGQRWVAFLTLWGFIVVAGSAALGQARLDYRSANPRQLVDAWKTTPREERAVLAQAMVARRAQVLPALRDSVRSGDRQEKLFACSMIAEMRDRDGVDTLVAASTDSDVKVRRRAATALRILADPRSARRLRDLLRSETDLGVGKTALAALGRIGQKRDVQLIEPFLNHGDEGARVVAAAALAMLGDERGLALTIEATYLDDPSVQKSATYALGFFSDPLAGERLRAILDDPNGAWKSYALIAQAERVLRRQSVAQQVSTLDGLASGRSRKLAEWAVDRLTDIGNADAATVLRKVRNRPTPVGAMAERRLSVIGAQP